MLGLLVVVGVCGMPWAISPRLQTALARARLGSSQPSVRKKGLQYIEAEREESAEPELAALLETETDPVMADLAGSALMRIGDLRGLEPLRRRADREPDSALKARLIVFAARLADRSDQIRDWLVTGAHTPQPWRCAGSCLGLLQLGRSEGGTLLLSARESLPAEPRDYALREFKVIVGPMAEAIGRPIAWPLEDTDDAKARSWALIADFWGTYATRELLDAVLTRVNHTDDSWREVDRLLHARIRVTRWIH